jgi:two-component system, OmpR family, sensor kinase
MTQPAPQTPHTPRHAAQPPAHSLRRRLLGFLLAAILLTALLLATVAYRTARAEADEIFDFQMQQMALSLRAGLPMADPRGGRGDLPDDLEQSFVIQVWSADGLRVFQSAHTALPQRAVLGFATVQARGATYRVFSLQSASHVIQVAQDVAARRQMAEALALRSVLPMALMAPLLMALTWWVVGHSLAPVARVRQQIAQRQANDLDPVNDHGLPAEVQPLVQELNGLLGRVRQAFDAQQRFVADAAHELRSPLAALKLQLQGLQRAADDAARDHAVARLSTGIDRATRLVEQLLVLARQQAGATEGLPAQALVLADVVRQALADATPAAQARQIDLGLAQADEARIDGHAEPLRILLRNLLDNAVKYTPPGGTVDVSVRREAGALALLVEDSGPGIAEADRDRALDRFHRLAGSAASGSGLGLAIVKAIADLHGATLELGQAARLGGLAVTVRFPLAR